MTQTDYYTLAKACRIDKDMGDGSQLTKKIKARQEFVDKARTILALSHCNPHNARVGIDILRVKDVFEGLGSAVGILPAA
jgi:hypothetical protein